MKDQGLRQSIWKPNKDNFKRDLPNKFKNVVFLPKDVKKKFEETVRKDDRKSKKAN